MADMAKQSFVDAFSSPGTTPEEQRARRCAAEEALGSEELKRMLVAHHEAKVEKAAQQHALDHQEALDRILRQVQGVQGQLKEALSARARLEKENAELRALQQEDLPGLEQQLAALQAENAECKDKLAQAGTALWNHEAALQEALQEASILRSELLTSSAAEEEVALLREELEKLRHSSQEGTDAEQHMQQLASEYQRTLADIGSLKATYEAEIQGLQEAAARKDKELVTAQEQLRASQEAHEESARKASSMQDVLSKRVVQLETKIQQQGLDKTAASEELEKLRQRASLAAEAEKRAAEAEVDAWAKKMKLAFGSLWRLSHSGRLDFAGLSLLHRHLGSETLPSLQRRSVESIASEMPLVWHMQR
ncbi:unnamed protein product [Effrenium voratum]|nr:unnamed protein product [Effrenium voratum]